MPTLTIAEMTSKLKSIGLTRKYKPYNDEANIDREKGDEVILLEVRKPAKITDGIMKGVNIDIYDDSTVRVWTSQKTKAMALARTNKFRIRPLDGEAELFIPTVVADQYLHALGAKVKKEMSPSRLAQMAQARAAMTPEQVAARNAGLARARTLRKKPVATHA